MDKKFSSFSNIFGKSPKGMSREEFNKGLQNYFEKIKKEYPNDPITAHKKMQMDLNRAALADFTDYPEVKDLETLKNQLLDYYPGLTREQKEKIRVEFEPENRERWGNKLAETGPYRQGDFVINLPELKKSGKYIPEREYAEKTEELLKEQLNPIATIFQPKNDPDQNLLALPHELRHIFDYYTAPYRMYRQEQEQLDYPKKGEKLKLLPPIKKGFAERKYEELTDKEKQILKKDPSYRDVDWITQQEHIQPLYVSDPPISGFDEWLFNQFNKTPQTEEEVVSSPKLHEAFSKIKNTVKPK